MMTTIAIDLDIDRTVEEHIETALLFLEQSQDELAAGDTLQGCEKVWGAVAHAVMANALNQNWDCGSHYLLNTAVKQLSNEHNDRSLRLAFGLAEKFHANFYHGFMESYQIDDDLLLLREFVGQLVSIAQSTSKE